MPHQIHRRLAIAVWLLLVPRLAGAQAPPAVHALTDRVSYNAGGEVRMRIAPVSGAMVPADVVFSATIRYGGESRAVFTSPSSQPWTLPAVSRSGQYFPLWTIPADARTGRYEIDLLGSDRISGQIVTRVSAAGSFAVFRKRVKIEQIQLEKTFYVSGDPVPCDITLKNLTRHDLRGLRVEFSNRYWPWIAGPAQRAASSIATLTRDLSLAAGAEQEIHSSRAAVAANVAEPTIHQYGVVVWDHARKSVLDIAFSQLVLIRPPGVDSPVPYPPQYLYPRLSDVNNPNYRHFYPGKLDSGAIMFDRKHTMFLPGSDAVVRFLVRNPGAARWKQVSIVAELVSPQGRVTKKKVLAERQDLAPGAAPLHESVHFVIPGAAGLYRADVLLSDTEKNTLAEEDLELGVNSLPRSILIFCAHEDDEGGWTGLIRAAEENHVPLHLVYFTSGDAGSCDRYYQHSCSPPEALNFGVLRMDETRAALHHLGVAREDIVFLGLPDGGSGEIWYHHREPTDPYLSVLLASDHSPYQGVFEPNLPYARKSVVAAVKTLIERLHPGVIVTAHPPAEGHIDHIVNNFFVVKALQELVQEKRLSPESVKLDVDRVYNPKQLPPTPYHYANRVLYVSGEVMALGQEARWFYQSQGGNRSEGNIRDFDNFPRTVTYRQVLDWNKHQGWNEKP